MLVKGVLQEGARHMRSLVSEKEGTARRPSPTTYIARSPGDGALFRGARGRIVGLALDAHVHNVIPADGAVIHLNVPGPERNCIPLKGLAAVSVWPLASACGYG